MDASPAPCVPILCGCGCGTLMSPTTTNGTPRRFIHGHNTRLQDMTGRAVKAWNTRGRLDRTPIPCGCGCGTPIEPFFKNGQRRRYVAGHSSRGRKRPARVIAAVQASVKPRRPSDWQPKGFASRYRDPRYNVWRLAVLERDQWTCQHCGHIARPRERHFAAHHIKPYATFPELRYEVSNGLALCYDCHWTEHAIYARDRQQVPCACGCGTLIWNVGDDGQPRRYMNNHQWRGRKRPGRVTSDDTRAKQSRGNVPGNVPGDISWDIEHADIGKCKSMKDHWKDRPRVGRPQSAETRAKISATLRAKRQEP